MTTASGTPDSFRKKKDPTRRIEETHCALGTNVFCGTNSLAGDDKPNLEADWIWSRRNVELGKRSARSLRIPNAWPLYGVTMSGESTLRAGFAPATGASASAEGDKLGPPGSAAAFLDTCLSVCSGVSAYGIGPVDPRKPKMSLPSPRKHLQAFPDCKQFRELSPTKRTSVRRLRSLGSADPIDD
jgi:hypothetical protein